MRVIGVIDGSSPEGIESAEEAEKRRGFLRMITPLGDNSGKEDS